MTVTADKPAPYTSPSVILDIIDRYRTKGLPSPLNMEVLGRAGVSDSLIPRTLQALRTLDLIDDDGKITPIFEGLRLAPQTEYNKRMEEWLNAAYADVLQFADPANDDDVKIRDAFRSYNPVGQQERMVTLFTSLYEAAGIRATKAAATRTSAPHSSSASSSIRKSKAASENKKPKVSAGLIASPMTGLPPALDGLLKSLPVNGGGWTKEQRDKFVTTFGAVIDFCFPIVEASASESGSSRNEEDRE